MKRREFIATASSAVLASQVSVAAAERTLATSELIRTENAKPGSLDWQLTRVRADAEEYRSPWIEGYCSHQSAMAGETIDIMISTKPARRVRLEFFRLGYYAGRGTEKWESLVRLQRRLSRPPSRVTRICTSADGKVQPS